MLKMESDGYAE